MSDNGERRHYSRKSMYNSKSFSNYESIYHDGYNSGKEQVAKKTRAVLGCGTWLIAGALVLSLVSCTSTNQVQARATDESVYEIAELCGISVSQVESYENPYELKVEQAKTELRDAFGNLVSAYFEESTHKNKANRAFKKAKKNSKSYLKKGEFIEETEEGEKYLRLENATGVELEFYIYDASKQEYNKEEIAKVITIYDVLLDQGVSNANDLFKRVYTVRGDGQVVSCSTETTFYSVLPSGIDNKESLKSYLSEWLILNESILFTDEEIKLLAKTPNN